MRRVDESSDFGISSILVGLDTALRCAPSWRTGMLLLILVSGVPFLSLPLMSDITKKHPAIPKITPQIKYFIWVI
jgi:hypothetical protein